MAHYYNSIYKLNLVLDSISDNKTVIIVGDFNNNRRGYKEDCKWHLTKIDEILQKFHFTRETPNGSSIYEEKPYNGDQAYEFAEDHFLIKGIKEFEIFDYNRDYVIRDNKIYKWDKNFQLYKGKLNGINQYDSIQAPYPDHAILLGSFTL